MAKKKAKKKKFTLNTPRVVRWLWIVVAAPFALLAAMLLLTGLGVFGKLPTFEELENPRNNLATEIYSEDGKMIGSFFVDNRTLVGYRDLNDSLVAALVSTEDMRYYAHSGIDFMSLARVGVKTVLLGQRQGGGSTISQQLAKNLFRIREKADSEAGISRKDPSIVIFKLQEWITAVRLEYNYTKEEIIAMYLNTVEFGSNAYGIKSAAQTFFNKEPSELTINESATLVGIINAPTRFSPTRNPENSKARRNTVIARMEASGFITRQQRDSLQALPLVTDYRPISHTSGSGTYFREMLRLTMTARKPVREDYNNANRTAAENEWNYEAALREWENNPLVGWTHKNLKPDGTPYNIFRDGLKIYTTINSSMQEYAEEAVWSRLENDIQPAMDAQIRNTKQVFVNTPKADADRLVRNGMRYSDRYREMKKAGATDAEIDKAFDTPVQMRVFTYKGDRDTLMTPRDSVLHHKKIMRASFMAMDPATGHVKAYVGGPDFRYFKYDQVKQGKRQVGSTIKPFIYTFAIDQLGYTPCTQVQNVRTTIETDTGEPWQPREASMKEDTYDGLFKDLWWGLALSRNNFSAWIMKQAKNPVAVADLIHRMGIKSYIYPVYALSLGTPDFSLYEMVGAYGTFANSGVYTEPIFVTRIEDRHGNLISAFTPTTSDAVSEHTAYTMLQMLQNVVSRGTAGRLRSQYGFTAQIGGKTGTSQENRDAWFMAVTPKIVAGAWVGGEDPAVHLRSRGEGSALALPIFGEFMKRVYADPRLGIYQTDTFRVPPGAVIYDCNTHREEASQQDPGTPDDDEFFD
ncbi:transglycosylase domain-containing protein [Alistipes sp. OttesenSCG-928-B03]|nr:transglycosylase domain-containing protein [Alistipes sp. OttesenSCG-928-B03]